MSHYRFGRRFLLLLASASLPLAAASAQNATPDELKAAAVWQDRNLTLDTHLDIPPEFGSGDHDAGRDGPGAFDLVKAQRGHLKGAVVAIFVQQNARTPEGYREAADKGRHKLAAIKSTVARYPDRVAIAHSPAEFRSIQASGKFAIVLAVLNGNLIGKDLSQIDAWHENGVQLFGLTHSGNNDLATPRVRTC